jgi:hypothetical protein
MYAPVFKDLGGTVGICAPGGGSMRSHSGFAWIFNENNHHREVHIIIGKYTPGFLLTLGRAVNFWIFAKPKIPESSLKPQAGGADRQTDKTPYERIP